MGTVDLSRAAFEPKKRYSGVRMQQGRVNVDDDFNEAERIEEDDDQRALVHLIGPVGTPDGGFLVANPHVTAAALDFDIGAGTLYLGGLRVWNPELVSYAAQPDWLQQPASARAMPSEGRVDLVYLEVWKQAVSAVEDAELFEAALAGPDTSARVRTMWRVRLATNVAGSDCPAAWAALTAAWDAAGLGVVSPQTGERVVDATLTVGLEPGGAPGDLCSPPVAGGYLGAENQAIRVELVDASHFSWGFDNASPLYRVQIGTDLTTIALETEPKDQAHWMRAGQIVEILPWSAVLPNNEKLAEQWGHLSRVQGSYDPELRTITLQTAVPAGFGEAWTTRPDAAALASTADDIHYYMRVWNRGDDTTSPPAIPFVAGTPVALGSTGLNVTFAGNDFVRSDHWIIAARPETPDQLVPWSLEHGRPPHGVRRYFAPLALVRWHVGGGSLTWDLLHDCRPSFPPLTRLHGCCTYSVGDGTHSFGLFSKIQDAVDALPLEGGKICVLPGEYREQVTIAGRRNVTIEGCGKRSRLLAPDDQSSYAVLIAGSQDITLRSLLVDAGQRPGILIWDSHGPTPIGSSGGVNGPFGGAIDHLTAQLDPPTQRILLEDLTILASALPALASYGGSFITLRTSEIEQGPLLAPIGEGDAGRWPAVFLLSDDVLIEQNQIRGLASKGEPVTASGTPTFISMAMGGIQIGGGSERVEIRRNNIDSGNGHGITLGSWAWVPVAQIESPWQQITDVWQLSPLGFGIIINDDGCIEIVWDPVPPGDGQGNPMLPVSMGDLRDIRIVDNLITHMGRSGIGVALFWPLIGRDELIRVERLTIADNRIVECLRLAIPELPPLLREAAGAGAIALADVELAVIRDNSIERNGRSHLEPVCGVFCLRATGIAVERNRILDNAPRVVTQDSPRSGFRGGVFVLQALPPSTEITIHGLPALRADGVPAARIVGNVITVPEGRCIVLAGQGTFSITDNQLTSRGVGTAGRGMQAGENLGAVSAFMDFLGGCSVFVWNLGRTQELGNQLVTWQGMSDVEVEPRPGLDATDPVLAGGDTLFAHNQVTLDLAETGAVAVGSSVVILALTDDVEVDANQLQVEQDRDLVLIHVLIAAWSARFTGNRCEETLIVNNEVTPGLSAFVFAPMAVATSNITSHCILVLAVLRAVADNVALIQAWNSDACVGADRAGTSLNRKYMSRG